MTTNKPNVQRYDNMGCPEEICRVDTMYESDDGYYVLYEDYEVLQVECEKLRKDAERYRCIRKGNQWIVAATQTGSQLDGEDLDDLIDTELEEKDEL